MTGGIHPVILCGGGGTRLWPRSRKARPKPFLPLLGEESLFQQTLARCSDKSLFAAPIVVAGRAHVAAIEEQAGGYEDVQLIVEPAARNTAPAIALAAWRLPEDAVMLVCPSDHHIADMAAFHAAAQAAAELAAQDWLVSFGIEADRPETGYGYIKRGEATEGGFRIERFVEKPDRERAEAFLSEGGFSWNGGIFAFRAGAFRDELTKHRPEMARAVADAVSNGTASEAQFHPDPEAFGRIEGESVDYALMENTDKAAVVPVSMGWSDIGNWQALHEARGKDAKGNAISGPAELVDCKNVLVDSDGPRVSAIGLHDIKIVVDGDEVLVTSADGAQLVGKLRGAKDQ